jgi:hypothetical protein
VTEKSEKKMGKIFLPNFCGPESQESPGFVEELKKGPGLKNEKKVRIAYYV